MGKKVINQRGGAPGLWWALALVALLGAAALVWAQTVHRQTVRPQYVNGLKAESDAFIVHTDGTATVTFQGADAAGAANTAYDTTGAGAITVGSADVTAVTITTDGTGNAEVVLPDSSVGQDEIAGMMMQVILCGEQANNGTIYMSPVSGFATGALYAAGTTANDLSYALGGAGCDAEDSGTEGTADEVLFANTAFKVLGMFCAVSSSGSNGVTLNLRSATANLTPNITITIPTTATTGATALTTTTDVAAGAAFALRVINTEDLSAQDAWCVANIMLQP